MKKLVLFVLIVTLALSLASCYRESGVLDEARDFSVSGEVHSLDIRINAADFKIEYGESFAIESNLKMLSVSTDSGVLKIVDEAKGPVSYTNATLTLVIPEGTVFEDVRIKTGAAKLTASSISSKNLDFDLGAGDVYIGSLLVSAEAEIDGGAGQITVMDGSISNLSLEMGVGELDMRAALLGDSEMEFGVGETSLTLLGGRDNYKVEIKGGIGGIFVDGEKVTDFGVSGVGQNEIEINGGVGEINLFFE